MISVDKYLDRKLDRETYNCLHFSDDVWFDVTGERLSERLGGLMGRLGTKRITKATVRAFRRLVEPVSPCIVIMKRPGAQPHMGVFIRGNVLHIQEHGVEFLPISLAARGFKSVRYYA